MALWDVARLWARLESQERGEPVEEAVHPRGRVHFQVTRGDGRIEDYYSPNLVTDAGDALIADKMSSSPARTPLDSSRAYIAVGVSSAATSKNTSWVGTQTGSAEAMDATYPKLKNGWSSANDNVFVWMATFEAGDLSTTIKEACLGNGITSDVADTFARTTVVDVVVTVADTLAITWEVTFLGA